MADGFWNHRDAKKKKGAPREKKKEPFEFLLAEVSSHRFLSNYELDMDVQKKGKPIRKRKKREEGGEEVRDVITMGALFFPPYYIFHKFSPGGN